MNLPILVYKDFAGSYIPALESLRGPVTVARHVQDMGELLGLAQTGIVRAILGVGDSSDFTVSVLRSLQSYGLAVVLLDDPEESGQMPRSLGHELRLSTLAGTEELVAALEASLDRVQAQPLEAEEELAGSQPQSTAVEYGIMGGLGSLLVFWGTGGAPGRSTLAAHGASYLAEQGYRVCLIDADTYAPSIFAILGMSEDYSTFSQLAHLAEKGTLTEDAFRQTVSTIRQGEVSFDVATGITLAERWPEIRQPAFEKILEVARTIYDYIVVDVNHLVEADEELSFDGVAPLRNGCTLTALELADHIFVLGNADAVGLPRLLKVVDQLQQGQPLIHPAAEIHLWANKVRAGASGNQPEQQIEHAWNRYQGQARFEGFIPWCPDLLDRALLTGQTLMEMGKKNTLLPVLEDMFAFTQRERAGLIPPPPQRDLLPPRQALVFQRERPEAKRSGLRGLFAGSRAKSR